MQIVQYQEDRLDASGARQKLADAVEEVAARLLRRKFERRRNVTEDLPKPRHQLRQLGRVFPERPAEPLLALRLAKRHLQHLDEWQVRMRLFRLDTTSKEYQRPLLRGVARALDREPGLAHARGERTQVPIAEVASLAAQVASFGQ